mmetsp:Transcript_11519/g.16289  ORF Transcript_11519/g.16289 Transcript_11519/m.16289 type:complete len:208 (-) Transcript_11519:839-1462(-)
MPIPPIPIPLMVKRMAKCKLMVPMMPLPMTMNHPLMMRTSCPKMEAKLLEIITLIIAMMIHSVLTAMIVILKMHAKETKTHPLLNHHYHHPNLNHQNPAAATCLSHPLKSLNRPNHPLPITRSENPPPKHPNTTVTRIPIPTLVSIPPTHHHPTKSPRKLPIPGPPPPSPHPERRHPPPPPPQPPKRKRRIPMHPNAPSPPSCTSHR